MEHAAQGAVHGVGRAARASGREDADMGGPGAAVPVLCHLQQRAPLRPPRAEPARDDRPGSGRVAAAVRARAVSEPGRGDVGAVHVDDRAGERRVRRPVSIVPLAARRGAAMRA